MQFLKALGVLAAIAALAYVGFAVDRAYIQYTANYGVALPQGPALFETSLQSRISSTDTSMTLVANSVRGGSALSGYQCFTIDEGRTDAEFVCGSISGTSVTSLERGVDALTGTSTNSALKFAHRVGANVKITDFPLIARLRNQANGIETFPNLLTYADTVLISLGSPTTTLATKYYVDNVAVAGASNADDTTKGIVETATAAEAAATTVSGGTGARLVLGANLATSTPTVSCSTFCVVLATAGKIAQSFLDLTASFTWTGTHVFNGLTTFNATTTVATTTRTGADFNGNITNTFTAGEVITGGTLPVPVLMGTSTSNIFIVDGNVASTTNFLGFAINTAAAAGTVYVQTDGIVKGFSGLTPGAKYYVSDTVGTLATTPGTAEVYVGRAISASQILIEHGSWQYLGSQTITTSATVTINQPYARFAVINYSINGAECEVNPAGSVTIAKYGVTSAAASEQCAQTGGADGMNTSYTWSGNGIVNAISGTASGQGATAYYYR